MAATVDGGAVLESEAALEALFVRARKVLRGGATLAHWGRAVLDPADTTDPEALGPAAMKVSRAVREKLLARKRELETNRPAVEEARLLHIAACELAGTGHAPNVTDPRLREILQRAHEQSRADFDARATIDAYLMRCVPCGLTLSALRGMGQFVPSGTVRDGSGVSVGVNPDDGDVALHALGVPALAGEANRIVPWLVSATWDELADLRIEPARLVGGPKSK